MTLTYLVSAFVVLREIENFAWKLCSEDLVLVMVVGWLLEETV